ncbi:MAG: hypothetical protein A2Z03_09495 [Chloroflexi bacterium RBG_16_56_8]|nr:MAG: hypothetical protein A2Z03_09495 [Chloroflexi bacterium RBG_16_56_8]
MTLVALIITIILSTGSLAWGYAQAGLDGLARWILIFGALWLIGLWRRLAWFSSWGLLAAVFTAGLGLWLEVSPGWLLAGSLFALLAWDLTEFRHRLSLAYFDDDLAGLERRHLLRLSLFALGGLTLASIAMIARLQFTFEWAVLLALVSALAITQLVRWLRNSK